MFKRFFPDHLRGQFLRYLIVGAWNTLFGYSCFFLLVRFFLNLLPAQPALTASIALVFATVINVTNKVALYNFLSTFSGTHFVPPRTLQLAFQLSF